MFTRKSIIKKTVQVSGSTLLSRALGIVRELLMVRYLGASALSDAFITAFKVPNSLRKIFAEGALSAAFIPTIVQTVRSDGPRAISSLMTLGFIVFESMVLVLCGIIMLCANQFIILIAPGFSSEQVAYATTFLYILMPFIFLVSSSALLAGPLQAVGHFFMPAFGPVLLNIFFIIGLIFCLLFNLPVTSLCWFILLGGLVQLLAHFYTYWRLGFRFGAIQQKDMKAFAHIMPKFFWCLLSMSVMEIGLFLDTSFGSMLSKGSMSLIYYANRFMGIPLGVFAVAFSTILLPHFSRISSYAPKRLGFYVLEATKLVWWVTFPVTIIMILLSNKIFYTVFLSEKFIQAQVDEAGMILVAFLCGLFFFAINKIVSNVYYALHETRIPGIIAVISVLTNAGLNWILMKQYAAVGLAAATTIAGIIQTVLLFGVLRYSFSLQFYFPSFIQFLYRYTLQILLVGIPFLGCYYGFMISISWLPEFFNYFLLEKMGFWLWVGPWCAAYMGTLYYTRSYFKVRLLFLE